MLSLDKDRVNRGGGGGGGDGCMWQLGCYVVKSMHGIANTISTPGLTKLIGDLHMGKVENSVAITKYINVV